MITKTNQELIDEAITNVEVFWRRQNPGEEAYVRANKALIELRTIKQDMEELSKFLSLLERPYG